MKNTIFVLALLAASSSMAATKITYDDVLNHIGQEGTVEHRGITATTADGKTHRGRRLHIYSDHLTISHGKFYENLPAPEVTRIEIRQAGRFFHHVVVSAVLIGAVAGPDPEVSDAAIILLPPLLAYAAATTSFLLAADGIAFLIPPKVYEIVH